MEGDGDGSGDRVAATITRPEYQGLFGALRGFAGSHGRRVVYVVGNHDAEVWWNPRVQRLLNEAGLVDAFALSYSASFASLPEQVVYCEHGNQFDPANAIADYANPLDTPVGAHVLTEMIRTLGSGSASTRGINLRQVRHVFPVAAHPGPAEWIGAEVWGTGGEIGYSVDGSHAELMAVPVASLRRKPKTLSFEQAAAMPLACGTGSAGTANRSPPAPGRGT